MSQLSEALAPSAVFSLLSRSLPCYLASWRELNERHGLFGSLDPTHYSMQSLDTSSPVIEYVVRPHLQVLCVLAAHLRSRDGTRYLNMFLPEEQARERVIRGVRWVCDTHLSGDTDVEQFLGRKRWGENWRSSLWTTQLALCTHLASDWLPAELQESARRVIAFEADRFTDVMPPSGCDVDTKLEENAIDTMLLAWALNEVPEHPHTADWERALQLWALNVAVTDEDRADHSEYCGRSVSYWVSARTLYPDMTAENHGFFHPEVLAYSMWVVLAMAAYRLNGKPVPGMLRRATHQRTFDMLLRFCLPNGMMLAPGGQDMPFFLPRPFALAWGLWNKDPRALRLSERLLAWMESSFADEYADAAPWVPGLKPATDGWALQIQSQVGFELALLAALPPAGPDTCFYSPGQIENAVDTRRIYPHVQICYRRNTRTSRTVAWKALGQHPLIGIALHDMPELVAPVRASLLGIPLTTPPVRRTTVLHHCDRFQRDGFDTYGRLVYHGEQGETLARRDVRVVSWGEDGMLVFDELVAEQALRLEEQYLSPVYVVNDHWTGGSLELASGSLVERMAHAPDRCRPQSCPSYWASVNTALLVQLIWGRTKGMVYVPTAEPNVPPYWKNCCVDMLALHVDSVDAQPGECLHRTGFFVGAGKGPRPFKCSGTAGPWFRGLVVMDGKTTLGID